MGYKPQEYWEERLNGKFSLAGTGHLGFGERYNRYMYALRKRALEKAIGDCRVEIRDKSVLDVGCGTGFFVDLYREKGAREVAGIDITDVSIAAMRQRFPSFSFFRFDIGQPCTELAKTFDIINIFDVLYHIVDDGAFAQAIANIAGWSKSGTWIFISDSLDPSKGAAEHVRYRTRGSYEDALGKAGIRIEEVVPVFRLMGQGVSPRMKNGLPRRLAARAIEATAWLSYYADTAYCPLEKSTMRLLVCRKT